MSKEKYEREAKNHQAQARYYFGKFIWGTMKIIKDECQYLFKIGNYQEIRKDLNKRPPNEAEIFLQVITHSRIELSSVQLIVFSVNKNNKFVVSLRKDILSSKYPAFIKNMIILDATKALNADELFVLDGHFNKQGHQVIADMLLKHIVNHDYQGQRKLSFGTR